MQSCLCVFARVLPGGPQVALGTGVAQSVPLAGKGHAPMPGGCSVLSGVFPNSSISVY